MDKKRVVVTGVGMITPLGIGVEESWNGLIAGRSGIRKITHFDSSNFPTQIAGEVEGFNPEDYIESKEIKKMDRFIHLAIAAATMAIDDSGLKITDRECRESRCDCRIRYGWAACNRTLPFCFT